MKNNKIRSRTLIKSNSIHHKENDVMMGYNEDNQNEEYKFHLVLDDIQIGNLTYSEFTKKWLFEYTNEFKSVSSQYNAILGFPDLDKKYESETLWAFFKIRIPGLKQPRIKEILREENINPEDNARLLKRFGHKTISNPFELNFI